VKFEVDVNGKVRNNQLLSLYARTIFTSSDSFGVTFGLFRERKVSLAVSASGRGDCSRERHHAISSRETTTIRSTARVDQ
jgi:hypothetical protein